MISLAYTLVVLWYFFSLFFSGAREWMVGKSEREKGKGARKENPTLFLSHLMNSLLSLFLSNNTLN